MDESELDKSESATPFKLKRARQKGQVARGIDLGFFTALAAFLGFAWVVGYQSAVGLARISALTLANSAMAINAPGALMAQAAQMFSAAMAPLMVLGATLFAVVIVFEFVQVGPVFSFQVLKPDFSRINPAKGLKRLLSWRLVIEAMKSVLKLAVYGTVSWLVIKTALASETFVLSDGKALSIALAAVGFKLLLYFALVALMFTAGDQILSRREFAKKMRMSRRELKREHRDREGDQRFKQKRKEFHNEFMKMAKSLRNARSADIILTNPTHVAVALRYLPDTMGAPSIVSRGSGELAARIRRIGFTYGIVVLEDPALARALFKTRILEAEIPDALFQPVADIYRRLDLVGKARTR